METDNVCGQVFHSMVSGLDWQPAKFRTSPEQPNVLGEMQDMLDYRFARLVVLRECCSRDHHAGSMHEHAGSIHGVHLYRYHRGRRCGEIHFGVGLDVLSHCCSPVFELESAS